MMRNKYVIFLVLLIVLVSLIGCLSKVLQDKEEVAIKDKETEQLELSFSTEKTNETNSQKDEYEITTSEKTINNSTTEAVVNTESSNTEKINSEITDTKAENKKPVNNTMTSKPTTNNTSTSTSEIREEQLPEVQEEETPSTPETSREAFDLINAERVNLGLEPAVWDAECERIALIRGEEIAPYAIPEHDGFLKFQNENRKLCECLAWGYLTAEGAVDGWMNSSAHKDILMDPEYVKLAIVRIGNKWVAVNSR